jgi:hypothetical protein
MRRAPLLVLACVLCCNHDQPPPDTGGQAASAADEQARQELVRAELARYDTFDVSFDASVLDDRDRALLRELLRAAELIEELNMLQTHPSNLEWRARVEAQGTDDDREMFRRYQMPWCNDDEQPSCVALPGIPAREIGAALWPEGMTDEEFEAISHAPNSRELLSPFTVVRRAGEGRWDAVPYSRTELLGPRMREVAAALRAAAEHADTPSLAAFLRSRADAFEADDPFPWDQSDYDWIALDSRWEVTVGPYEVYQDPRQVKARFEMVVGLLDPEVTAATAVFRDNLQEMEDAVASLAGSDVYQARRLAGERIAVRAIQVIIAAGDGRRPVGATVAYHLPNRGRSVDEGLYKKVIMVNHSAAFEPIMAARAQAVLEPDQAALVNGHEAVLGTTFHELAHGLGSYDDLAITVGGERTTVGEALDEVSSLLEESKADVVGLWLMEQRRRAGAIDDAQAARWYVTHVMHVFGLLQYPLADTYPRMVAIQLGFYMERGAITYDEGSGRFRVHLDRMPAAVEELARRVVRIQLTGDREGADRLQAEHVVRGDDGELRLAPAIASPVAAMRERFAQAGIRSINIRYRVTGP